jgi:GLPGLI family protein
MKIFSYILVCFFGLNTFNSFAQKKISDFSIVYDYEISNGTSASKPVTGSNSIFIKGSLSRSETGSQSYSSAIIHDATTGTTVILKEVSGQKILIRLTPQNWKQMNAADEAITFSNTTETKTIAGYKCIKAVAKTTDGSDYAVYFTSELSVDNSDYNLKFKNLAGLALEYEIRKGNLKIKYTVAKLNLNPVPESKFDIPKTGYREMTFEESKKLNAGQ